MTDTDPPRLNLDAPPPGVLRARNSRGFPGFFIWLLLILQVAVLIKLFLLDDDGSLGTSIQNGDETRSAALVLEEHGLDGEAAELWEQYLANHPGDKDRAAIRFRVGKLRMQSRHYEEAAAHLILAEKWAEEDGVSLAGDVDSKVIECLRRLGRYGDVGRELARRVDADPSQSVDDKVLASYAGETIKESTLDRLVERVVDDQLALFQGEGPSREELIKAYRTQEAKAKFLQDYLSQELLARKARDEGLDDEEAFLDRLASVEARLLADLYLTKRLEAVQPTDVDIRSFFQSESDRFVIPGGLRTRVVSLDPDSDAQALLGGLESLQEFNDAVKDLESFEFLAKPGEVEPRLGIDVLAQTGLEEGEWTREPLELDDRRFLVAVLEVVSDHMPTLDEVRRQVEMAYRTEKQSELREQIFRSLMKEYDVRLHTGEGG